MWSPLVRRHLFNHLENTPCVSVLTGYLNQLKGACHIHISYHDTPFVYYFVNKLIGHSKRDLNRGPRVQYCLREFEISVS